MKNNVHLWIFIFIISLMGMPCAAQSPDEIESKMNEIKLNDSFIYGEDYNENKDMAYLNALSELLSSINELREEKNIALINTSDLQPIVKELRYTKGTKNLSFLYLGLTQALSLTPKAKPDDVSITGNPANRPNQIIEPKKEEEKPQFTFVPDKPTAPVTAALTQSNKDILESLCSQDNWVEIKGFLTEFKNEGIIKATGNCLSYSEVPDDAYSILMDEMGGILSILSPKNSPDRINHKTNQTDNENNHPNCKFIVWYK